MKTGFLIRVGLVTLTCLSSGKNFANEFSTSTAPVGRNGDVLVTPVNQVVTPSGTQVELAGIRPNALALSPDGKMLAVSGLTQELVIVDPTDGKILQRVPFPADKAQNGKPVVEAILNPNERPQLSFTGLKFSPDGSRIYLSNVNGDLKVFAVGKGDKISPLFSIALPTFKTLDRTNEIPAGLAISRDGKKIYVAFNLSDQLAEIDVATGEILRIWEVGAAPFDVALAGQKIYVSNWGGRRPAADSATGPSGNGTRVRVDERSIASEGSVSVIDLNSENKKPKSEIVIGPHACALTVSPDGKYVVAASAGSDMLSVIDTRSDEVVETLTIRTSPSRCPTTLQARCGKVGHDCLRLGRPAVLSPSPSAR